jgi:iron complex transport system substrate-binding protein
VLNGRATVAGSNTSADAMLRLAGAENAVAKVTGFRPLADEAGVELAPDAIVAMKHGRMGPPSEAIATVNALKASPAMQQNRIIEMNSLYLLGFGPRCASAARDLMKAFYPELKLTAAGEVK